MRPNSFSLQVAKYHNTKQTLYAEAVALTLHSLAKRTASADKPACPGLATFTPLYTHVRQKPCTSVSKCSPFSRYGTHPHRSSGCFRHPSDSILCRFDCRFGVRCAGSVYMWISIRRSVSPSRRCTDRHPRLGLQIVA